MKKYLGLSLIAFGFLSGCASSKTIHRPSPLVDYTPSASFHHLWTTQAGRGKGNKLVSLEPTLMRDSLIVPDAFGRLTQLDTIDGQVINQTNYNVPFASGVGVHNGNAYVVTENGDLVAIQLGKNQLLWKQHLSSIALAAPVANENWVYAKTIDGAFTAMDRQTGKVLWGIHEAQPTLQLRAASNPVRHYDELYVGFDNGILSRINPKSGNAYWKARIGIPKGANDVTRMVDIDTTPIVTRSHVYAAAYQGKIKALSASSGNALWEKSFSTHKNMALDNNRLIAVDDESVVWAFNAKNGSILWKNEEMKYRGLMGPVFLDRQVVIIDRTGRLFALSAEDGHLIARTRATYSTVNNDPIVYNDKVMIMNTQGKVYAFRLQK